MVPEGPASDPSGDHLRLAEHESVGKEIVEQDPEIRSRLEAAGISPQRVYRIFTRESTEIFTNLVSSDLDADRIDYLLRTAHHTGLPYGSVDLDYLLSQMQLDEQDVLCIKPHAVRAADHFLLSRVFSYGLPLTMLAFSRRSGSFPSLPKAIT